MTQVSAPLYLSRLHLNPRHRDVRKALGEHSLYALLLKAFDESLAHHHHEETGEDRGLLYRIEPRPDQRPPQVIVQSTEPPDWNRLSAEVWAPKVHEPFATASLNPQLSSGDRLRFRVRVSPTVSVPGQQVPGEPGKRERGKPCVAYWKVLEEYRQPLAEALAAQDRRRHEQLTREKSAKIQGALAEWFSSRIAPAASLVPIEEDSWFDFTGEGSSPKPLQLRIIQELPFRTHPRQEGIGESKRGKGDHTPVIFEGLMQVKDPTELDRLLRKGIGRGKAYGCGLLSLARG